MREHTKIEFDKRYVVPCKHLSPPLIV